MTEMMTQTLQQHVLSLLLFDSEHSKTIANCLDLDSWVSDSGIRDVVRMAYEHVKLYSTAPGELAYDFLERSIYKDERKQGVLREVIRSCEMRVDTVPREAVLKSIEDFNRISTIKKGLQLAAQHVMDGKIPEAELAMSDALKQRRLIFNPGMKMTDWIINHQMAENSPTLVIPLGIPALDDRGLIPTAGTMWLLMAPPKGGKTWGLIHAGKMALLQNKKVLHITLEVSEEVVHQRYAQSIYGYAKRNPKGPRLVIGNDDFQLADEVHYPLFSNPKDVMELAKKIRSSNHDKNLWVKQFPTGSLTVDALEAYMETLEDIYGFVPDLVILDYADLMKVTANNYRLDLRLNYELLRGLAVQRGFALATATQINREGSRSARADSTHVSEDYSKIATADCIITINRSEVEGELGIARLFVASARNEEDKFEIMISQNYQSGQFALTSTESSKYWKERLKIATDKWGGEKADQPKERVDYREKAEAA